MSSSNDSSNNNNGREAIVDKLHGALAAFRRERDDLHRKKELAVERMRLVKEEHDATEKTVRSMQAKLMELQSSASSEAAQREVAKLRQEVERLNRENQFQHTELVAKRAKMTRLETQMAEDAKIRQASLRKALEQVRRRREIHDLPQLTPAQQVEKMKKELNEVDNKERLWPKWPRLVEEKAAEVAMEASDHHRSSENLRKVVAGYQKHFGALPMESNASASQQ